MKILSVKRGFVTNSSSDNFWFIVLEKKRNAIDDMADQISDKRGMWAETIKSAIKMALDNALCVPDFFLEFYDFSYAPMYGLDLEKLAEADDETVSMLIEDVNKLMRRCRKEYEKEGRPIEFEFDITKYKGIITLPREDERPIMEYVKETYFNLLKISEKVNNAVLEKLVSRIIALAKVGLFRIEKGALTYALICFINNVLGKNGMKITITYTQVPQGEHPWESIASRITEEDVEKFTKIIERIQKLIESANCELTLGIDADYLLIWGPEGPYYKPLLSELKKAKSFAIAHFRGTWFPLSELMNFLDEHELKQQILKAITEGKEKGDALARVVASILKVKDYIIGDECIPAYEYTDDFTSARGWYAEK